MGMTIKDAMPILHDLCNYYNDVDVDAYVGFDNEDNAAMETALATMRKYQQIQEIYERFRKDGGYLPRMAWLDVMEVIMKDGNDNCGNPDSLNLYI